MTYCPKCGAQAAGDQKFCRSCGFGLQEVLALLAGEDAEGQVKAEPVDTRNAKLFRRGVVTFLCSLMIGSLILFFAGLKEYFPAVTPLIPLVLGISGVLLFAGLLMAAYSGMLPEATKAREPVRPLAEPTAQLPSEHQVDLITSVTESTTELLAATEARAKMRDTTR